MSESETLFSVLRRAADANAVDALEQLVLKGQDRALCRINAIDFAAQFDLREETAIAVLLHASRIGLLDMSWNVLCPGCGGVLDATATLKSVQQEEYHCATCAAGYEPTLDEMVEVIFTVSPRVRRIAAHDPDSLPIWEYYRQIHWSTAIDLPEEGFDDLIKDIAIDAVEVPAGERAELSLVLPSEFIIIFEPVTHSALFLDVKGELTSERRDISIVFNKGHSPTLTQVVQPGPVRLLFDNRSDTRMLPAVLIAADRLHDLLGRRKAFLSARRLLSNQTFRDLYQTDTLDIDQRLKITSLTFLFTDLRSSTALYERVGDLVAFDLVRSHFRVLLDIVAEESGAVIKTIGDAVMATFLSPEHAVNAALRMREGMRAFNAAHGQSDRDLSLKIGIHEGPCLAVLLNERQDFFGQTVNVASRVQGAANSTAILATDAIVHNTAAAALLERSGIEPLPRPTMLRGLAGEVTLYEIP
jgi:class 3 adenylate cyclase